MRFTKRDFSNESFKNYLRSYITPVAHLQSEGSSVAVYESETVIKSLIGRIEEFAEVNQHRKSVAKWKQHLVLIKSMES